MKTYKEILTDAMLMLAKDKRTIFIGQGVKYSGHGMFKSLQEVPDDKKIEMPVCEELQMGICTGMAIDGFLPVSIFPRMDFLICATNQLVNHLDKIDEMSEGEFKPKVIIRTAVGSKDPLMPGCQHTGDYAEALDKMLTNVDVYVLKDKTEIVPVYFNALKSPRSTLIVELPDMYNT